MKFFTTWYCSSGIRVLFPVRDGYTLPMRHYMLNWHFYCILALCSIDVDLPELLLRSSPITVSVDISHFCAMDSFHLSNYQKIEKILTSTEYHALQDVQVNITANRPQTTKAYTNRPNVTKHANWTTDHLNDSFPRETFTSLTRSLWSPQICIFLILCVPVGYVYNSQVTWRRVYTIKR